MKILKIRKKDSILFRVLFKNGKFYILFHTRYKVVNSMKSALNTYIERIPNMQIHGLSSWKICGFHRYFDAREQIKIRRLFTLAAASSAPSDFNNFSLTHTPVSWVYGILRYFMPDFINIFMRFRLGGTFYCNCTARATDIPEITIYIPPTGKYRTPQTESVLFMRIYLFVTLHLFRFSDLSRYIQ